MRSEKEKATILATIKQYSTTKSFAEIADLLGLSSGALTYVWRLAGFKKPHVFPDHRAKQIRMRKLFQAHSRTHSMAHMGRMLGVSRERVRQLCNQWHIEHRHLWSKLRLLSDRELRKAVHQPTKSFKAMARELGVTDKTLTDELSRRGIKPFTLRQHNASLRKRGLETCYRCRRVMPFDQFVRDAAYPTGYGVCCLECARALARERYKRKGARNLRGRA